MAMSTPTNTTATRAASAPCALVLGLGASGLAMARWLSQQGWQVQVADNRAAPPQLAQLQALVPTAHFCHSPNFAVTLLDSDIQLVATSPGISPHPEASGNSAALRAAAAERGIPVWGELELFARSLHELDTLYAYRPHILAITGSNGKTTVTSLCQRLLQASGQHLEVAGNIGPNLLDRLSAALEGHCLPDIWLLELSSFQLHDSFSLQASAATILNISPDHLDWHGDLASYCADKLRIFGANTTAIINRDEPELAKQIQAPQSIDFGLQSQPKRHLSLGLEADGDMHWLVQCHSDLGSTPAKRKQTPELSWQRLMPVERLRIQGQHNYSNALAALAFLSAIGLELGAALHTLAQYTGEPHRTQTVASIAGVRYIDDSKGTNVGASLAAIRSLGAGLADSAKLLLILGGVGKGQDFRPLAPALAQFARGVAYIGQDAAVMQSALALDLPQCQCATLEAAVGWCAAQAHTGDVVLLSPACASLDMFPSYVARGEAFARCVTARHTTEAAS